MTIDNIIDNLEIKKDAADASAEQAYDAGPGQSFCRGKAFAFDYALKMIKQHKQSQLTIQSVPTDEFVDSIITALNRYGRNVCKYEFGLPDYDDHVANMRQIIRDILT